LNALPSRRTIQKIRLGLRGFGTDWSGWSEGRNLRIDYRFAPAASPDQAQPFAKELVALRPDAILAQTRKKSKPHTSTHKFSVEVHVVRWMNGRRRL